MRTFNIKVPSLLNQYTLPDVYDNNFDLNKRFWKYIFSEAFYKKYINIHNPQLFGLILSCESADKDFMSYLSNFSDTDALKNAHKTFYSVINYYNQVLFWKHNINLSISRNFVYNGKSPLVDSILFDILEQFKFEKNQSYSLKIYFDNEIHTALVIAKYLKDNYNAFIEIDTFTHSDEQVDFGPYSSLETNYFVDRVITYNNFMKHPVQKMRINYISDTFLTQNNSKSIRFFKRACFWNKCAFCTINAQHAHVKDVEDPIETIEKHVSYLKENPDIKFVFFSDEAIEHSILVNFCQRLIEEKIEIKMSVRARYEKEYKEEDIKILGLAGVRFLGIGLESASSRLNILIGKRDFELEPSEINKHIDLFNKYGINLHQYFMIGLPSETKEETDATFNFIKENLFSRDYFTFSANVFSLNKGSKIFRKPEKYGIEVYDSSFKSQGVPFKNIVGDSYSYNELRTMSNKLYFYMFFDPDYIDDKLNYGYDFWDFVDRTLIFYTQKLIYSKNPYLKF